MQLQSAKSSGMHASLPGKTATAARRPVVKRAWLRFHVFVPCQLIAFA